MVDDSTRCSDGAVVGMGVSWLVGNVDLHVMVLRVLDDVVGDKVGVDLEMIVGQSGVLVCWVDQ